MRQLKFHEQKLLKKVNMTIDPSATARANQVMYRYQVNRTEYTQYNILVGKITSLANRLSLLDPKDPFRAQMTANLLKKMYQMGLLSSDAHLSACSKLSVSAFCRRRLGVIMVKLRMAQTVTIANKYIRQGHIRVGPEMVTDTAFLVPLHLEDFITWTDSSKIKEKVLRYNDKLDDFDLQQ